MSTSIPKPDVSPEDGAVSRTVSHMVSALRLAFRRNDRELFNQAVAMAVTPVPKTRTKTDKDTKEKTEITVNVDHRTEFLKTLALAWVEDGLPIVGYLPAYTDFMKTLMSAAAKEMTASEFVARMTRVFNTLEGDLSERSSYPVTTLPVSLTSDRMNELVARTAQARAEGKTISIVQSLVSSFMSPEDTLEDVMTLVDAAITVFAEYPTKTDTQPVFESAAGRLMLMSSLESTTKYKAHVESVATALKSVVRNCVTSQAPEMIRPALMTICLLVKDECPVGVDVNFNSVVDEWLADMEEDELTDAEELLEEWNSTPYDTFEHDELVNNSTTVEGQATKTTEVDEQFMTIPDEFLWTDDTLQDLADRSEGRLGGMTTADFFARMRKTHNIESTTKTKKASSSSSKAPRAVTPVITDETYLEEGGPRVLAVRTKVDKETKEREITAMTVAYPHPVVNAGGDGVETQYWVLHQKKTPANVRYAMAVGRLMGRMGVTYPTLRQVGEQILSNEVESSLLHEGTWGPALKADGTVDLVHLGCVPLMRIREKEVDSDFVDQVINLAILCSLAGLNFSCKDFVRHRVGDRQLAVLPIWTTRPASRTLDKSDDVMKALFSGAGCPQWLKKRMAAALNEKHEEFVAMVDIVCERLLDDPETYPLLPTSDARRMPLSSPDQVSDWAEHLSTLITEHNERDGEPPEAPEVDAATDDAGKETPALSKKKRALEEDEEEEEENGPAAPAPAKTKKIVGGKKVLVGGKGKGLLRKVTTTRVNA